MATTIIEPTQPKHWIPSGNPIVYKFSTNNTLPKLSYIIDVIINGSVVCQLKYAVYNRNDMSIDFNRIVNDYIKDGWTNDYNVFARTYADTLKLELIVHEQNENSAPVIGGSSSEIYVWYAVADFQKSRYLWDYYTYNDLTGTSYNQFGRFLGVHNYVPDVVNNTMPGVYPNKPKGRPIIFNNLYKISPTTKRSMSFFLTSTYTNASKHTQLMQCWCYNEHYELTKRFGCEIHTATWTDNQYDRKIGAIPVGVQELNNVTWDSILLDNATLNYIDPSEDKYYFITVCSYDIYGRIIPNLSDNLPQGNKWVGFEIIPCNQYKVYNILYQTSEGGWWQIRCDRKHSRETKVETNIKYNPWYPTPYGSPIANDVTFKQVMHTDAEGSITLNTNWIENQGIIREIEDMIISPRIFLVEDTELGANSPVYIPVLLKDSTYQIYNKEQDRLFKYEFEFEEGYKTPTLK